MQRAFQALTAEPWAIDPSWLSILSAIARRDHAAPELRERADFAERDYQLMAGPGAQKIACAHRAYAVDGVAVLPIVGPIFPRANMMTEMSGATSITMLQNDLRVAMESAEIFAIMPLVDSPGGAVSGINSFADALHGAAQKKPVTVHVAGSAASAAYWIASSGSEIAIEKTGMVGSIGVVVAMMKQVQPNAEGELQFEIVSSNAPNKRPDPESEDGRAEIVGLLDAIEKQFIADVARGRKSTIEKVIADFGRGGMKVGAAAKAAGMVDRVQSQEATLAGLRRQAANARRLAALKNP